MLVELRRIGDVASAGPEVVSGIVADVASVEGGRMHMGSRRVGGGRRAFRRV